MFLSPAPGARQNMALRHRASLNNPHIVLEVGTSYSPQVQSALRILASTYPDGASIDYNDPFRVLVATVVSQGTREDRTGAVCDRLFARYPDVEAFSAADEMELREVLFGSQYREVKAPRLIEIARTLIAQHGGSVPDELKALLGIPGIGRKTATCVLIYGFNKPAICVNTHTHRIANRLGWVRTTSPAETARALERAIPGDLRAGSNCLFLQHGRAVCVSGVPRCSQCPILFACDYGKDPASVKR